MLLAPIKAKADMSCIKSIHKLPLFSPRWIGRRGRIYPNGPGHRGGGSTRWLTETM